MLAAGVHHQRAPVNDRRAEHAVADGQPDGSLYRKRTVHVQPLVRFGVLHAALNHPRRQLRTELREQQQSVIMGLR